jgi:hypothetical protein
MAYCRFSSDDFRCDVYCYEHCDGGFVTHVAANTSRGWIPRVLRHPPLSVITRRRENLWRAAVYHLWSFGWSLSYRAQMKYLAIAPRRALGLPYDGQTFHDATPGDAADWLEHLRRCGYRVPQYAIDGLREEQAAGMEAEPA